MEDNKSNQRNASTVLEPIEQRFKCNLCDSISMPVQDTNFNVPLEYRLLEIYVCSYCDTGFVLMDQSDGFTERQDLSRNLVKDWNPIPW